METNQTSDADKTSPFILLIRILWFVFCMIAFSDAGTNILVFFAAAAIVGIWVTVWLVRLFIFWRKCQKARLRPWLVEVATMILPLLLAYSGVFSAVRFTLSKPSLTNYVADVRAGKVNLNFEFSHPARQIGLYSITITELLPDGTVRIITSSDGLLNSAGFANSPHSPPLRQGEDSYKHIQQRWWYWYQSW